MRAIIYPYNLSSETSKILAELFETKRVKPDGNYRYLSNDLIINWGNGNRPNWDNGRISILNHWDKVKNSINKIRSFEIFKENNIAAVESTTNKETARSWIAAGKTVMCRMVITGHSGNGIVVAKTAAELVDAPLYTKYFDGKYEYRLHFMKGKLIDFTQKKQSSEREDVNNYIRSYDNGWVFCRDGVTLPQIVVEQSRKAIIALGLDFGAVDIRYSVRHNSCGILEVNSAPALQGSTQDSYVNAFHKVLINEELTDINYGSFVSDSAPNAETAPAIEQVRPVMPQVVVSQEVVSNQLELLYSFPSGQDIQVLKSGNDYILKLKINGRQQMITI